MMSSRGRQLLQTQRAEDRQNLSWVISHRFLREDEKSNTFLFCCLLISDQECFVSTTDRNKDTEVGLKLNSDRVCVTKLLFRVGLLFRFPLKDASETRNCVWVWLLCVCVCMTGSKVTAVGSCCSSCLSLWTLAVSMQQQLLAASAAGSGSASSNYLLHFVSFSVLICLSKIVIVILAFILIVIINSCRSNHCPRELAGWDDRDRMCFHDENSASGASVYNSIAEFYQSTGDTQNEAW